MRANEFIAEAVSSKVYHYTSTQNAYKILSTRTFRLSAAGGSESERALQKGRLYFLSTARSPSADYTLSSLGSFGVMFNLNGDWFNQRFKGAPVDYWERSWWDSENNRRVYGDRTSEQEDRILSDTQFIKMGTQMSQVIESVHILVDLSRDLLASRGGLLRGVLLEAKKAGIPTYIYPDENSFLTQNTAKAIPMSQLRDFLAKNERPPIRQSSYELRDDFKKYRELFHKTERSQLSKEADKELYNMFMYGDRGRVLDVDIHNMRKHDNAGLSKLMAIFRQIGVKTGGEFVEWVKNKWKDKMR